MASLKGGLISEGILTLVTLPKQCAKSLPGAESLTNCKLFTVKNFLLRGKIWHSFLAMSPNLTYILRFSGWDHKVKTYPQNGSFLAIKELVNTVYIKYNEQ